MERWGFREEGHQKAIMGPLGRVTLIINGIKEESSLFFHSGLCNWSLEAGTFPSIWKCDKVTALFKGGDRPDINNYRPITVLPTIN